MKMAGNQFAPLFNRVFQGVFFAVSRDSNATGEGQAPDW